MLTTAQPTGCGQHGSGGLASDPVVSSAPPCFVTRGRTMFLMWLGEQITSAAFGNVISLIIFVGIIAEIPAGVAQVL